MTIPVSIACAILAPSLSAGEPAVPRSRADRTLPDEDLRMIFDKGKIAAEAYQRLVGLEESGRPHIPKGTVLEDAQEDPKATQVDLEALRQRTISLYETRAYDPSPIAPLSEEEVAAPIPQARPVRDRGWFSQCVAAGSLIAIGALLSLYLKFAFRPRRHVPPNPASSERTQARARPRPTRSPAA